MQIDILNYLDEEEIKESAKRAVNQVFVEQARNNFNNWNGQEQLKQAFVDVQSIPYFKSEDFRVRTIRAFEDVKIDNYTLNYNSDLKKVQLECINEVLEEKRDDFTKEAIEFYNNYKIGEYQLNGSLQVELSNALKSIEITKSLKEKVKVAVDNLNITDDKIQETIRREIHSIIEDSIYELREKMNDCIPAYLSNVKEKIENQ